MEDISFTKEIISDVERIIKYSQDYPFDLDAEALINAWYQAKKPFIDKFNGATTLRSPQKISFKLSPKERRHRFDNFLADLDDLGVLTYDFEVFLRDNQESFYENKVTIPYDLLDIKPNAKLSKSFKKFITEEDILRAVQDIASRYMQEDRIEGYLTLSVDPRDFLTLSENNEGWWSCHSLDSDYRAGNLSYMTDSVTLVAYLSNGKDTQLRCFPKGLLWNSKKWRMLVHTNLDTCVYYDRQYPYEASILVDMIQDLIKSIIPQNNFQIHPLNYGFKKVTYGDGLMTNFDNNYVCLGGRAFDARDIIDTSDYIGYCDLIKSPSYTPVITIDEERMRTYAMKYCHGINAPLEKEYKDLKKLIGLKIGGKVPCPCCGQGALTHGNMLLCPECVEKYDADEPFYMTCYECGRRIYDDNFIDDNGVIYCKKCYNHLIEEGEIY